MSIWYVLIHRKGITARVVLVGDGICISLHPLRIRSQDRVKCREEAEGGWEGWEAMMGIWPQAAGRRREGWQQHPGNPLVSPRKGRSLVPQALHEVTKEEQVWSGP